MSDKETERYHILSKFHARELSLEIASNTLKLSRRHTLRLSKRLRLEGKEGLISRHRGRQSNRAVPEETYEKVLSLLRTKYYEFGPTLVSEKLREAEDISLCRETLRKLMIKKGLWTPKKRKRQRFFQRRPRRKRVGELIQLDGSPHDWFEGRAPACTLLLAVDDASSKLMAGRFAEGETTADYFHLFEGYVEKHGLPLALYTDKYSAFRVNRKGCHAKTQFAQAMDTLKVELINAHSPQAKGRVERANGILQDRLVKELRLQHISSIEEANTFLPSYIEDYNRRFGKEPSSSIDAHRPLDQNVDLTTILCFKETRKLSKNLELQYDNIIYQIDAPGKTNRLKGAKVTMTKTLDGRLIMMYNGEELNYCKYEEAAFQPPVLDHKQLAQRWEKSAQARRRSASLNHPWRS